MKRHNKNLKVEVSTPRADLLRSKLLREISDYERQLSELKLSDNHVNFTMIQTYKELIGSRQDMLSRLPVHY
jgi:hypothetical protein